MNAQNPSAVGSFAKLIHTLSDLQRQFSRDESPIRTALVTVRNAPAHERVIRTLREWDVRIDEAFFFWRNGETGSTAILWCTYLFR